MVYLHTAAVLSVVGLYAYLFGTIWYYRRRNARRGF